MNGHLSNIGKTNIETRNQIKERNDNGYVKSVNPTESDSILLLETINNNVNKLLEKKTKSKKKTYYPITEQMFKKEVLPEFCDFPDDKIHLIFSDGKTNYVKIGNKKHELNKKNFLKFRNTIL